MRMSVCVFVCVSVDLIISQKCHNFETETAGGGVDNTETCSKFIINHLWADNGGEMKASERKNDYSLSMWSSMYHSLITRP